MMDMWTDTQIQGAIFSQGSYALGPEPYGI